MRVFCRWAAAILISTTGVMAQPAPVGFLCEVIPNGLANLPGNGVSTNVFGLSTATRARVQFIYDSSLFSHQGPMLIQDISWRPRDAILDNPLGTMWSDVTVTLATVPNLATASSTFNSNLIGATVVRSGTYSTGVIAPSGGATATFIPLGMTTPFLYDPSTGEDLVLEIRKCSGDPISTGALAGTGNVDVFTGTPLARRILHTGTTDLSCSGAAGGTGATGTLSTLSANTHSPFAMVIELCFSPVGPKWEPNSPEMTMTLDGAGPSGPIFASKCKNQYTRLVFSSVLSPAPWDVMLTTSVPIPAGPGFPGILTTGQQAINVDLGAPDLTFLFGLALANSVPTFFNVPVQLTSASPRMTGQAFVIDPTHIDGAQLSAVCSLKYDDPVTLLAPVAGPTLDESIVAVNVGCVPFFNRGYSQLFVESNGRVKFEANTTDFSPTAVEANASEPQFGAWCDFQPDQALSLATITISSPSPQLFRVDFVNVPYFSGAPPSPVTATFGLEIDACSGTVRMDGLLGILNPLPLNHPMFLGLSAGSFRENNAGLTAFSVGGPNVAASPRTMLYNFGQAGTLAPGVTALIFTPIVGGSYDTDYSWTGL